VGRGASNREGRREAGEQGTMGGRESTVRLNKRRAVQKGEEGREKQKNEGREGVFEEKR